MFINVLFDIIRLVGEMKLIQRKMQFKWMFEELVLLYQTTKGINKDKDIKAHITTPQGNCKNDYEINQLY